MIFRPFRDIHYCVKSVIIIYSSRLQVWVLTAVCVRCNSPVYLIHSDIPLRKSRLLLLRYFVLSEERISMADSSRPSSSTNVGNLVCHVPPMEVPRPPSRSIKYFSSYFALLLPLLFIPHLNITFKCI